VNETWNLLRTNGFIALAPGINGVNGLMVLTRAGEEASASSKAFDRVRAGKSFPKTMLHPAIADERLVGAHAWRSRRSRLGSGAQCWRVRRHRYRRGTDAQGVSCR
jgi:hypothetical protein